MRFTRRLLRTKSPWLLAPQPALVWPWLEPSHPSRSGRRSDDIDENAVSSATGQLRSERYGAMAAGCDVP